MRAEGEEGVAQVESEIDRVLNRAAVFGQMPQRRQCVLESFDRLPIGRSGECLGSSLTEIDESLLELCALLGVVASSSTWSVRRSAYSRSIASTMAACNPPRRSCSRLRYATSWVSACLKVYSRSGKRRTS